MSISSIKSIVRPPENRNVSSVWEGWEGWGMKNAMQDGCLPRMREGYRVSKMEEPASRKWKARKGAKWKVKSGETRKSPQTPQTSQTSQTSQYSQTNCAGRVSPANAGRVTGVQNGGLKQTQRTKLTGGEKSRTPVSPMKDAVQTGCPK